MAASLDLGLLGNRVALARRSDQAGIDNLPADLVARYGGEEIAIILPDTDAAGAVKIAGDVRASVEALAIAHVGNPEGGGIVTLSAGAATALSRYGASLQMPAGLLQAADTALYKAKSNGRNRVETALLLSGEGPTSPLL